MSEDNHIQAEILKLSTPEAVIGCVEGLRKDAKDKLSSAMGRFGWAGGLAITSGISAALVSRDLYQPAGYEMVLLHGAITGLSLLGSGLNAYLGVHSLAESQDSSNRAAGLESALATHLMNRLNSKQ